MSLVIPTDLFGIYDSKGGETKEETDDPEDNARLAARAGSARK